MVTLAFLVAACLDPVQAAPSARSSFIAYRGPQPVLAAGAAAALATETVMALAAAGYVWGEVDRAAPGGGAGCRPRLSVLAVWARAHRRHAAPAPPSALGRLAARRRQRRPGGA